MGLRDRLKEKAKSVLGLGARPTRTDAPPSDAPSLPTGATADGYVAVGHASRVTEGKAGSFPHGGAVVAVFRHQGKLWAIDNACAHEDGPVGEGAVAGCRVRCPYHDWEYDFTTGACLTEPERPLATWSVRERDGLVWIGPRLTEGTQHRGGAHNDGMETIIR